jgi:hypothetical protein
MKILCPMIVTRSSVSLEPIDSGAKPEQIDPLLFPDHVMIPLVDIGHGK